MESTRTSGAGVAFFVLAVLLQLVAVSCIQAVRRALLWAAVGVMAAVFVALGLVGSAAARAR